MKNKNALFIFLVTLCTLKSATAGKRGAFVPDPEDQIKALEEYLANVEEERRKVADVLKRVILYPGEFERAQEQARSREDELLVNCQAETGLPLNHLKSDATRDDIRKFVQRSELGKKSRDNESPEE
ncbi:MAG: hypothetical protein Q8Q25_02135 [bacterium]|nr:hypothetical protein [bacterium]